MAPQLIEVHFPENPDEEVRIRTRRADNLPPHVKGSAVWVPKEPVEQSSYQAPVEGIYLPVEFINHTWFTLEWSNQDQAYYTCQENALEPRDYDLGWWEEDDLYNPYRRQPTPGPSTVPLPPTDVTSPFESSSIPFPSPLISTVLETLPESPASSPPESEEPPPESEEPSPEQETQRMRMPSGMSLGDLRAQEQNPFNMTVTEGQQSAVAVQYDMEGFVTMDDGQMHTFVAPAMIHATQTATQIVQPQVQYAAHTGGGGTPDPQGPPSDPGDGNGDGGGGQGPPDGPPGPVQLPGGIVFPPVNGGALKGNPPTLFDGTRSKSMTFLRQFKIWRLLNHDVAVLNIPFNRVLMALTFMRGDKVNDWVYGISSWLDRENQTGVNHRNEDLWDEFERRFVAAFKDTTQTQDALTQLMGLTMIGEDLDTYNSKFNHLIELAEWGEDDQGTTLLYRRGLKNGLHRAILEKTSPWPTTLIGWQDAARRQHAVYKEVKVSMDQTKPGRWVQLKGKKKSNEPTPMDVDTIRTTSMTSDEKKKLFEEKKCFYCKKEGHISKNCPKKKKKKEEKEKGAANAVETSDAASQGSDSTCVPQDKLMDQIRGLSESDRNSLYDELQSLDSDF